MTSSTKSLTFECDTCGEQHEIPLNMGFSMPDFVNKLLPWERTERCQISEDWCIVDESLFWIRGCLEVPIKGTDKTFSWGVWTTLGEDDFDTTMELWNDSSRVSEPPYQGSLANTLPTYTETRNLELTVQTRDVGDRPLLTSIDPDHKLSADQRDGMSMERAIELAKMILHSAAGSPWSSRCER
jgi:hypothetical protein